MEKLPIRDESLDDLAETLAEMLGVSQSDAVRLALRNEIERQRSTPTIDDQIAALRERVKSYGYKSARIVPPSRKR